MKRLAACLFTALFVLALLPAFPARADIAPPPAPHGGDILPEAQTTNVRMVAEKVLIEALPNANGQDPVGHVSADFQMRNMGDKDEAMTVRFPLNIVYTGYFCAFASDFKPVQDFQAWIDDKPAPITIERKVPDNAPWSEKQDCWAYFPAVFPVGKNVQVRVSYTQAAGPSAYDIEAFMTYPYVLQTGAGWYDTIGSVDITFRAPSELNKENLIDWGPIKGQVLGNEIHWQFKDFEPKDSGDDINVTIVNPAVWRELVRGRKNTVANPQDGEAWGRLGKALKEMTISVSHRGIYREDYYRGSYAAYQKAVELKPWDADWHFGFAELLYNQVVINTLSGPALTDDFRRDCVIQLKAALDINPKHEQARKFLYYNFGYDENRNGQEVTQEWIPKYALEAYFLPISTEMHATQTKEAIDRETEVATYYPTDTSTPTVTLQPSKTLTPRSSPMVIAQLGETITPSPIQVTPTNPSSGGGICGSIIIPVMIIAGFWLKRWK